MFERYFLDKRALTNYRVYRLIKSLPDGNFTVNRLSREADISYSLAYNAFQDILADLVFGFPPANTPTNEADFAALAKRVSVDAYRFALLNQSMAYQFFDYAFTVAKPDVHAFCAVHGYHESTLRRRVAPFRQYLASRNIRLNASTWALEGDEAQIRITMLTFYQMAYRGCGWPFSARAFTLARRRITEIDAGDPTWFVPQPYYTKIHLMILAVQAIRITTGHPIPADARVAALFAQVDAPVQRLLFTASTFPMLTAAECDAERDFYYFCQVHYLSVTTEVAPEQTRLVNYLGELPFPIAPFVDGLLAALTKAAPADSPEANPANHGRLRVKLIRFATSVYVLHGRFSAREDFDDTSAVKSQPGRLSGLIQAYIDALSEDPPIGPDAAYLNDMTPDLYQFVAPDFPALNRDRRLRVAVLMDSGTFTSRDLQLILRGLGFVTIISPDDAVPPDVIITTVGTPGVLRRYYPEPYLEKAAIITWHGEVTDDDYFALLARLRAIFHGKSQPVELAN